MSKIHVRLLKAAKKRLGEDRYICIAIKLACERLYAVEYSADMDRYKRLHRPTYDILAAIHEAIGGGYETAGTWLEAQNIFLSYDELLDYRQQWLDQMITYWSRK